MITAAQRPNTAVLGPPALLLVTGALLGAMFALGKVATQAGVVPLAYALAMHLGAGVLLAVTARRQSGGVPVSMRYLRYYALSGLFSMAVPNAVLLIVIPHLGAGLASVVYALPALFTLVLAAALKVGPAPTRLGSIGIGLGALGTLLILTPGASLPSADLSLWMLLALAIPVSVAIGNVYRTVDWPKDASPLALAAGMLLGASGWIAIGLVATGSLIDLGTLARAPVAVTFQILISAVTFIFYFRLQLLAGPVYLSQIGYVMTATGLASGVLLGETYPSVVWLAVGLIAFGVVLTTRARG